MGTSNVSSRLREVISTSLDIPLERIVDDASFVDNLAADSLDLVQLALDIEDTFGVEIGPQDFAGLETVGDAVRHLELALRAPIEAQQGPVSAGAPNDTVPS